MRGTIWRRVGGSRARALRRAPSGRRSANKQADLAYVSAADPEKAACFASAEVVRWIEWGLRSDQNLALGAALLLFAVAVLRTSEVPRLIGYLMVVSGITYLWQGWIVGSQGFTETMSIAIVASWVVGVMWMIWLVAVAWRMRDSQAVRGG